MITLSYNSDILAESIGKTKGNVTVRKPWENKGKTDGIAKRLEFEFMYFLEFLQKPWKSMVFRVPKTLVKQTKIKWKSWKFKKCSNLNSCIFWKVRVQGEMENAIVEP